MTYKHMAFFQFELINSRYLRSGRCADMGKGKICTSKHGNQPARKKERRKQAEYKNAQKANYHYEKRHYHYSSPLLKPINWLCFASSISPFSSSKPLIFLSSSFFPSRVASSSRCSLSGWGWPSPESCL